MKLHHVGIVVRDLGIYGCSYAESLGLHPASDVFHDTIQKVHIQFWKDEGGNLLELIEPSEPDSPVRRALEKGRGLNHLCYEVDDIEQQVKIAIDHGAIQTTGIVPAVAFGGRRVVFLYFRHMDLIEFVEAER